LRPRQFWKLIAAVQLILFLSHWFLYETWTAFHATADPPQISGLQLALALLSVSFVVASLLAWRYSHWTVRLIYTASAIWVGVLSFCVMAAFACWIAYGIVMLAHVHLTLPVIANVLFAFALLASLWGLMNAAWTRVSRITVELPNLPDSWRDRAAVLVSDTHLGHVRNLRFIRRIVKKVGSLRPDVVFITGDMYDGTAAEVSRLAEPWAGLSAPLGAYFVTGNHEEFTSRNRYLEGLGQAGIRVLNNEKVTLDGLQIVGVHFHESIDPDRFQSVLRAAALDRERPSILLLHAPHQLPIVEQEGVSLQLCGHTHGGQFPPWSWITSRIYGQYVHGLNRFGKLLIFTTWGAGTWGPPMRVGTKPEIVLITFA
jgi:uncharacterized protein